MKNTKLLLGVIPAMVLTIGVSSVYAFSGNGNFEGKKGANFADRSEMMDIMENNDYEAFVKLHDGKLPVDETTFAKMVQAHEARISGDFAKSEAIRSELSALKDTHRAEKRALVDSALEAGDYNAFVEALAGNDRMLDQVTAENFSSFKEMHDARVAGDFVKAREIADSLGLERPMNGVMKMGGRDGEGKGQGSHDGRGMGKGQKFAK